MTEATQYVDERIGDRSAEPMPTMSAAERAEIEAHLHEARESSDSRYQELLLNAQACARRTPLSGTESIETWESTVSDAVEDLRSGRALLEQLGADRLLHPRTTATFLAMRRGLIEEFRATSASELTLIDAAVIASANATRIEAMIGNAALLIESEMFGQQAMRAKWKKTHGSGREQINGLAVDEHIAMLRDRLMPLAERFHRMARECIEALGRMRRAPSLNVERAEAVQIVLAAAGPSA
jgi:hypothetical protein